LPQFRGLVYFLQKKKKKYKEKVKKHLTREKACDIMYHAADERKHIEKIFKKLFKKGLTK